MVLKKEDTDSRFSLLDRGFELERSYKGRTVTLTWNGVEQCVSANYMGAGYILNVVDPLLLRLIGWTIEDYFEPWGKE